MEATAARKKTTVTATKCRGGVERNTVRTRLFHTAVYLATFVLLLTGWWLWSGREGRPSPLARLASSSDVTIHEGAGWALALLTAGVTIVGWRGIRRFTVESLSFARSDVRWFARWPRAVFTGDFASHDGHFDPGQRIANILIVGCLGALVVTGFGLIATSGGPAFVWFLRIHKWSTYLLTPILAGHVIIGLGVPPGYRGVTGAIHRPGRISEDTARRLWPAWAERAHRSRDRNR